MISFYQLQNARMVEVGRDHSRSSRAMPLLKQAQLQRVAQDCIQPGFKYLQQWRLHKFSGQPIPAFNHPQGKEVFSYACSYMGQQCRLKI